MRISIIGQGYVGLSLAICAAKSDHDVVGLDVDEKTIAKLREGVTLVPGIEKKVLLQLLKKSKYTPSCDPKSINGSEIIIIAVPTPLDKYREPNLKYLEEASAIIGNHAINPALVINESTSYPGTLREFIKPHIESISKVKFEYASAPERIDPGNSKWNLKNTPRVIGALTPEAQKKAVKFYKSFCKEIYEVDSPEIAEASKLFENTFRQVNIALANEFSIISNSLGFSTIEAIKAAATKPFGFMPFFPSIGVGGHCIPVDPSYLTYASRKAGTNANLIELSNKINLDMVSNIVMRLKHFLNDSLSGKKIQIAGIAYKPEVSDLRESPVLDLIRELRANGAFVNWHDPLVANYNSEKSTDLDSSIDLGIIATPHSEIDFNVWRKSFIPVVDLSANSNNYGWRKFL